MSEISLVRKQNKTVISQSHYQVSITQQKRHIVQHIFLAQYR